MTHQEALLELERMEARLNGISAQLAAGGTILRRDIALIAAGSPYYVEGTTTYRIPTEDPNQIILLLVIPAGSVLGFHDHDCPERGTTVVGLVEVNRAQYGFMQQYRFNPYEVHAMKAIEDSTVLLEFPPASP
jgi:hypothetical protein